MGIGGFVFGLRDVDVYDEGNARVGFLVGFNGIFVEHASVVAAKSDAEACFAHCNGSFRRMSAQGRSKWCINQAMTVVIESLKKACSKGSVGFRPNDVEVEMRGRCSRLWQVLSSCLASSLKNRADVPTSYTTTLSRGRWNNSNTFDFQSLFSLDCKGTGPE